MKKMDKYILALLLLLAGGIYAFNELILYRVSPGKELIAIVEANNAPIREINLSAVTEEERFMITQRGYENEIIVEPGRIRMGYANCPEPDHYHQNWIHRPNEILVCLPNFVVIRIEGENATLDGVTY